MSSRQVHVRCTDAGGWALHVEGQDEPVSTHATVTEAELAARRYVRVSGGGPVVVHDLYGRTRVVPGIRDPRAAGVGG